MFFIHIADLFCVKIYLTSSLLNAIAILLLLTVKSLYFGADEIIVNQLLPRQCRYYFRKNF